MKRKLAWLLSLCMAANFWTAVPVSAAMTESENTAACRELIQRFYDALIYPETDDADTLAQVAAMDSDVASYLNRRVDTAGRNTVFSDSGISSPNNSNEIANVTTARLQTMARAYRSPNSAYYNDADLLQKLKDDLHLIYTVAYNEEKFKEYYPAYNNPSQMKGNWWAWECGVPGNLSDIYVLLEDKLDPERLATYLRVCDIFVPSPFYAACGNPTGANAVWITDTVMKVTALRGNPPYTGKPADYPENSWREPQLGLSGFSNKLEACKKKVNDMLVITDSKDGFYWDGSYLGHDAHAYSGGYGLYYYNDTLSYIDKIVGTAYGPTPESMEVLTKWTFDSMEPMIYDVNFLISTIGRETGRKRDELSMTKSVLPGLLYYEKMTRMDYFRDYMTEETKARTRSMIKFIAERYEELRGRDALLSGLSKSHIAQLTEIMNDETVISRGQNVQSRIFPVMCKMINYKPTWGSAVSYYDLQVKSHEDGNENKKGWHWNNGMVYIYNDEPDAFSGNYFATVDAWKHSGTTVVEDSKVKLPANASGYTNQSFGGGASLDQAYTALAFNLKPVSHVNDVNTNLNANKSYFGFDDELVCLGTDISATTAGKSVWTTFENRKITGHEDTTFLVDGTEPVPTEGDTAQIAGATWAWYEGANEKAHIGYYFPQKETITVKRDKRTGDWADVTSSGGGVATDTYLTMYTDHGAQPTDGTYQYVILPDMTADEVAAYSESPNIEVTAFSQYVHGVYNKEKDIYAANFYAANQEKAGPIRSEGISSVMMQTVGDEVHIAVADPTKKASTLRFTIDCKAGSVIAADPEITVTQMGSKLGFTVNTKNSDGKTFRITVSSVPADYTGQKSMETFSDGQFNGNVISNNLAGSAEVVSVIEGSSNRVLKIEQKANQAKVLSYSFDDGNTEIFKELTGTTYSDAVNHGEGEGQSLCLSGISATTIEVPDDKYILDVWFYDEDPTKAISAYLIAADIFVGISTANTKNQNYMAGEWKVYNDTGIARTKGWHKITIDASDFNSVKAYIDREQNPNPVYTKAITAFTTVEFDDWWGEGAAGGAKLYFDDLTLRTANVVESALTVEQANPYLTNAATFGANLSSAYTGREEIDVFSISGGSGEAALRLTLKEGALYAYSGGHKDVPMKVKDIAAGAWFSAGAYVNADDSTMNVYVDGEKILDNEPTIDTLSACGNIYHAIGNTDAVLYVDNVLTVPGDSDYFASEVQDVYDVTEPATYSLYGAASAEPKNGGLEVENLGTVFAETFETDLSQWGRNPAQPNRAMPEISQDMARSGLSGLKLTAISEAMTTFEEGNYIVEGYIYRPSTSRGSTAILYAAGPNDNIVFGINHLQWSDEYYAFRINGSITVTNVKIKENQWVKLTMDFSAGNKIRLLIDDEVVYDGTTGPLSINSVDVGNWWTQNAGPVYVDDVTIRKPGGSGTIAFENQSLLPGMGRAVFHMDVAVEDTAAVTTPFALKAITGETVLAVSVKDGAFIGPDGAELLQAESKTTYRLTAVTDTESRTADIYIDGTKYGSAFALANPAAYLAAETGTGSSGVTVTSVMIENELSKPEIAYAFYDAATKKKVTALPAAGQTLCLRTTDEEIAGCDIYIAAYSADGKVLDITKTSMEAADDETVLESGSFTVIEQVAAIKGFAFQKNTLQPLKAPVVLQK